MYRINISKLPELDEFLSENFLKGMLWAIVDYNYISLRKECVECFKTEEEAKKYKGSRLRGGKPSVLPLLPLYKIIHTLNKHQSDHEINIWSMHFDPDKIYKNWKSKNKELITTKTNFMNEKNLEHLKDNVKYLGFGEKLNEDLQKNLMEGKDFFQLKFTSEVNRKPFEAVLNFRKSESTGNYFLNSYQASQERTSGQRMAQTFYLDNGKGVTAKESYNLLEGRAVHKELENKEGQKYNAWLQLDFTNRDKRDNHEVKQYHSNYGYDLKEAVSKLAVAELKDPVKEKALMQSLEKGNIQAVTIEKDGFTHKMFIEANPQYKVVNLYDANMKRVQKENLSQYQAVVPTSETVTKEEQSQKQDQTKDKKRNLKNDMEGPAKKNSRSKKRSISI